MPKKKKRRTRKKSVTKSKAKRKPIRIRAASKRSFGRKKKFSPKRKRVTSTGAVVGTASLPSVERLQNRDNEAGDLQRLSNRAMLNSESVEELLEEANALEAEVVQGGKNADADEGEVKTHEVPEDDVPEEYL